MRSLVVFLLLAHGVAHVAGFAVPWKLVVSPEVPYRTTVLRGSVDIGDSAVRLLGLVWLAVATAFVAIAVAAFDQRAWWYSGALALSAVSLVLCVLGLPEARLGLVANAVILAVLIVGRTWRAFPEIV